MLTLKAKCLIAYCHTILTESETLTTEGKGIAIVEDKGTQNFLRSSGFAIIQYCERVGATYRDLSNLSNSRSPLFMMAREYYGIQTKLYQKYIAPIEGRHIPILYATIMFQMLRSSGVVGLSIDYDKLLSCLEESNILEKKEITSRFSDRIIIENTEVKKYLDGVRLIIDVVMKMKMKTKRVSKSKKKVRR